MFQFSTEETYNDGEIIFEEGASGDWVYVIQSGSVEISKRVMGEKVVIEILKPGDILGELSFISRIPRTATARALGATRVGIIDRTFLDYEFNKLSGSFKTILQSLAQRLIKTTNAATQVKLRRNSVRSPKVLSLGFRTAEGFIDAFSDNLSADGIFIKTSTPLPKGETFGLKLILPNAKEPIMIDCEVIWSQTKPEDPSLRHPGMGAKFTRIEPGDRQKLMEEIEKSSPFVKQRP